MNRPALDFIHPPVHRASRVGLLLGGAMLVAAAVHYQELSAKLHAAQQEWDMRSQQKARTAKKPGSAEQNPTVKAALKGLGMSWEPLFDAIEAAARPHVALLAMEPDAGKGTVRLFLEAKDEKAMQQYVQGLAAQPGLAQVSLLSQETQLENPQLPIRFSVGAAWQQ